MTPTTTDELIPDWTFDRTTPDLIAVLEDAVAAVRWLDVDEEAREQPASVDEFLAWLDSEDFERDAHERLREQAWRG